MVSIQATGRTETVHNLAITGHHNYHVATTTGQPILVHNNGCEVTGQGSVNMGELDDLERPTGVTAHLTPDMVGTGSKVPPSLKPPGFEGGSAGQARGHLLGAQLGGDGTNPRNVVTLTQNPTNTPVMRGYENQVRKALDAGAEVDYTSTPIYKGDDLVPRGVTLTADGSNCLNLGVSILNGGK